MRRAKEAMAVERDPERAGRRVYETAPGGWEDPMGTRPFSVRSGPTLTFVPVSIGTNPVLIPESALIVTLTLGLYWLTTITTSRPAPGTCRHRCPLSSLHTRPRIGRSDHHERRQACLLSPVPRSNPTDFWENAEYHPRTHYVAGPPAAAKLHSFGHGGTGAITLPHPTSMALLAASPSGPGPRTKTSRIFALGGQKHKV